MEKMHVVYVTDEKYAMPTGVSMQSLLRNFKYKDRLVVHIIAVNVSEKSQDRWRKIANNCASLDIVSKTAEKYISITDDAVVNSHVTQTSMMKFDIADIFYDLDKCLYLDGDTIINNDISDIFDLDLSGAYVAAIMDMGDENDDGQSYLGKKIGLEDNDYFNSGVMLLNLALMREKNMHEKLLDYRLNRINFFMDQDAFNIVLGKKKIILPYMYNCLTSVFEQFDFDTLNKKYFLGEFSSPEECIKNQKIIHMTYRMKPWIYYMPYFSTIFLKYYKQSPYKSEPISLESPVLYLRKQMQEMRKKMDWKFPYSKIPMGAKVIIYGAGDVGESYVRQMSNCRYCNIVLWCDRAYENKGEDVETPQNIIGCVYDYVVVALSDEKRFKEVYRYLVELGVHENKIVRCF